MQHSLVIGARGEIGSAIVDAFLARGDKVAALDLAEAEIHQQQPGLYRGPIDVLQADQVDRAIGLALDWLGPPDVFVNAVGVMQRGPLLAMSDQDFEHTVAVNLTGAFRSTRAVSRVMAAARGGSILHLSSVHGQTGMPDRCAYAASKGGIEAMVKALAAELGPQGISVNALAPGPIGAGMGGVGRARHGLTQLAPLGRVAQVGEVANCAAFLTAPASRAITGQVITLDCGLTSTLLSRTAPQETGCVQ